MILSTLTVVLLHLFSGWLFVLPLELFERLDVGESLRVSRALAEGRRIRLIAWLAAWGFATTFLSALGTGIVGLLGQLTVPHATSSMPLLLFAVGAMVILWTIVTVSTNLLCTTSFASLLFTLYEELDREGCADAPHFQGIAAQRFSIGFDLTGRRLFLGGLAAVVCAMTAGMLMLNTIRLVD